MRTADEFLTAEKSKLGKGDQEALTVAARCLAAFLNQQKNPDVLARRHEAATFADHATDYQKFFFITPPETVTKILRMYDVMKTKELWSAITGAPLDPVAQPRWHEVEKELVPEAQILKDLGELKGDSLGAYVTTLVQEKATLLSTLQARREARPDLPVAAMNANSAAVLDRLQFLNKQIRDVRPRLPQEVAASLATTQPQQVLSSTSEIRTARQQIVQNSVPRGMAAVRLEIASEAAALQPAAPKGPSALSRLFRSGFETAAAKVKGVKAQTQDWADSTFNALSSSKAVMRLASGAAAGVVLATTLSASSTIGNSAPMPAAQKAVPSTRMVTGTVAPVATNVLTVKAQPAAVAVPDAPVVAAPQAQAAPVLLATVHRQAVVHHAAKAPVQETAATDDLSPKVSFNGKASRFGADVWKGVCTSVKTAKDVCSNMVLGS